MHEATPANGPDRQTDWDCVDWRKTNRIVRNLRQRIFRASREGSHRTVQSLQKLMLRLEPAPVGPARDAGQRGEVHSGR